jgi:hypothetical protein
VKAPRSTPVTMITAVSRYETPRATGDTDIHRALADDHERKLSGDTRQLG